MSKNVPRVRMIAGPNGSGKSTLMELLKTEVKTGFYINPDEIEASLNKIPVLHFADFGFNTTQKKFISFVERDKSIGTAAFKKKITTSVSVQKNILVLNKALINSYTASLLADFLRLNMFANNQSFTFETVMSHPSKLEIIDTATSLKYKTYLYFIFTKNPVINIERIKTRTQKGGHNVNSKKTFDRFYRSLALLPDAIKKCNRAFIFDNTVSLKLIAEFKDGKEVNKNSDYKKLINAITGK